MDVNSDQVERLQKSPSNVAFGDNGAPPIQEKKQRVRSLRVLRATLPGFAGTPSPPTTENARKEDTRRHKVAAKLTLRALNAMIALLAREGPFQIAT